MYEFKRCWKPKNYEQRSGLSLVVTAPKIINKILDIVFCYRRVIFRELIEVTWLSGFNFVSIVLKKI